MPEIDIMKNLILLTLLISTAFGSLAQNQPTGNAPSTSVKKGNAKVIGAVIDAETNQPVEFANIALIDPTTNKPVDGTVCDDQGKFAMAKVVAGTYTVSISFIGYETQTIENVTIPDKKEELSLGIIKLATSAKLLNEVVVEGQKQLIEEKVDRTVYNAENDQTTKGGDATDVLKRVPMLSVDLDGNVSMRGNQNVRVLINNKPSTIAASSIADALKQIPADQIKSVEVITSPSAKYDAEGSAGIINIITKKNTLEGATLNIDMGAGLRGSNLGLNGSYRKGKMGFSLGGFGRAMYNVNGEYYNKQTIGSTETIQEAKTRSNNIFGRYNLGWDYDINKNNFIAASVRYGIRNGSNYQDNVITTDNNPNSNDGLRNSKTVDNSGTVDVSLDYTHTFEKPQQEFSISTLYSRNNRNNNFLNTIYTNQSVDSLLKNLNESFNQEITIQADYQTPIKNTMLIEFGGKEIMRRVSSDYKYFVADGENQPFIPLSGSRATNVFNYDQNVTAGYFSYTYNSQKSYSFKAGARYEYTVIDANFQNTGETVAKIPSYGVLVPSVNVSKKLKNGNTVKLAYNRRIQRPSIQFLNPNIQASNPLNISQGNPNLDPEFTNNYELGYSTFVKGTSLNFSAFVRNTTGSIQSVRTNLNDSTIFTTYQNIGVENAYGLSAFSNVNIGNKLSLNGGVDVYYAMLDNKLTDPLLAATNEGWVASGRMFGSYNLSKGWGLQFFGFYRGRQVQLQGTQGGFGTYSLGVKKDFANKKGSFGFGAENFFTTSMKIKNNLETPTIDQYSVNTLHNLSFRVNVSFRLGKMSFDSAPKRRKKSVSNDDLKDGGGDGGGGQADATPTQQRPGGGGFAPGQGNAAKPAPAGAVASKVVSADSTAVADATGVWNYTVESPQGGSGVLTITKEGDKLIGKIKNNQFNRENDLTVIALNGNELSFSYEVSFGGNAMVVQVNAIVNGDDLSGNMAVGTFGTYPIQAKRTK